MGTTRGCMDASKRGIARERGEDSRRYQKTNNQNEHSKRRFRALWSRAIPFALVRQGQSRGYQTQDWRVLHVIKSAHLATLCGAQRLYIAASTAVFTHDTLKLPTLRKSRPRGASTRSMARSSLTPTRACDKRAAGPSGRAGLLRAHTADAAAVATARRRCKKKESADALRERNRACPRRR